MHLVKKNKLVLIILFLFIVVTGYLLFELQNVRSELRMVQQSQAPVEDREDQLKNGSQLSDSTSSERSQTSKEQFDRNIIAGNIRELGNIGIIGYIDDQQYAQGTVAYYEAGTIQTGEYKGYKRIIVLKQGQVNTYAVMYTNDFENFIHIDGEDTSITDSSTDKEVVKASIDEARELDIFPRNIILDDYVLVRERILYSISGELELIDNSDAVKEDFQIEGLDMLSDYEDGFIPESYNEEGLLQEENGVGLVDATGLAYRYQKVEKDPDGLPFEDISEDEEGIKIIESYILSQIPNLVVKNEPVDSEVRLCQIDNCNTPEAMQDDGNYIVIPAEEISFGATQGEGPVGSPVEAEQFREALESYGFVLEGGGPVDSGIHYYEYSQGSTWCAVNYGGAYENEILLRCGEMGQ